MSSHLTVVCAARKQTSPSPVHRDQARGVNFDAECYRQGGDFASRSFGMAGSIHVRPYRSQPLVLQKAWPGPMVVSGSIPAASTFPYLSLCGVVSAAPRKGRKTSVFAQNFFRAVWT